MNQHQIMEAASFLIDECPGYRIEDFVMMFTLAKRGKLAYDGNKARVFDRIDIQLISEFKDGYDYMRRCYGESQQVREMQERETTYKPPVSPKQTSVDAIINEFKARQKAAREEYVNNLSSKETPATDRIIEEIRSKGYDGPIIVPFKKRPFVFEEVKPWLKSKILSEYTELYLSPMRIQKMAQKVSNIKKKLLKLK